MRVDSRGNFIPSTGFDHTEYRPEMAGSRSVYLGEQSQAEQRAHVMAMSRARAAGEVEASIKRREQKEMRAKIAEQEVLQASMRGAADRHQLEVMRKRDKLKSLGMLSAHLQDTPIFTGNHMAGFGSDGEEYLDPDSDAPIEVADEGVQMVEEFGVAQTMEPRADEFNEGSMYEGRGMKRGSMTNLDASNEWGQSSRWSSPLAEGESYVNADGSPLSPLVPSTKGSSNLSSTNFNPMDFLRRGGGVQGSSTVQVSDNKTTPVASSSSAGLLDGIDSKTLKYAAVGVLALMLLRRR